MITANHEIFYNNYKIQITFIDKQPNFLQILICNPNIDHGFVYLIPFDQNEIDINNSSAIEQYVINHPQFIISFNSAVEKFPYVQ